MRRSRLFATTLIAFATLLLFTAARVRVVRSPVPPKPLSATRSFEITDKPIVEFFSLDRVLTQLIERSGVTGITPQQLMRQMFDTQNPRPGLADPAGAHCDDTLIKSVPSFNGFPRRCPTPEGKLAATPYLAGDYFTLGIANRFDLAPPDGSDCGQYRLVFAHRETGVLDRLHIIFEAVLPNPNPSAGIAGCRPVAQFWSDLSSVESMKLRRARLEEFFFDGLEGFPPVIDVANLSGRGGIRTVQQVAGPATNRFYQFRLVKTCASGDCTLRFTPDVLENMPYGLLFDGADESNQARAFRDEFVRQVPTLAINDLNLFHMKIPNEYLMVESNPIESFGAFAYELPFNQSKAGGEGLVFRERIQAELDRVGSTITPENIIVRAEHQTCHGCHGFNGAIPLGGGLKLEIGFGGIQMISEDILMDGEAGPGTRYGVDPIVEKQFVPHRMQILQDFLRDGTPPVHSN
ncbi:MAG TPA: hypothetical protein VMU84_12170 [Thermoanaerobaculia bacterium]|nr:hypothetical protein [Thermoanaerobaculia bacterium]